MPKAYPASAVVSVSNLLLGAPTCFRARSIQTSAGKELKYPLSIQYKKKKSPELKDLPKAPFLRSLQFKGGLNGSVDNVAPGVGRFSTDVLDPTHPAIGLSQKALPSSRSTLFTLRCFPFAMLRPFRTSHTPYPFPPKQGSSHSLPVFPQHARRAPMALVSFAAKKGVHESAVIRSIVKLRMKEALRLVVTRGASVDATGRIIFNNDEIGESKWLLNEWIYTFTPTLEMYKHPMDGIISSVRSALSHIRTQGSAMESEWIVSREFATYAENNEIAIEEWLISSESRSKASITHNPDTQRQSKQMNGVRKRQNSVPST